MDLLGPGLAKIATKIAKSRMNIINSMKVTSKFKYIYSTFPANITLNNHRPNVSINDDITTNKFILSKPETIGETTAIPKTTCPALSKIFESLSN